MTERIFIVEPGSKNLTRNQSVTFSQIGVKEVQDLEEWVVATPELLGEELLVVTSEFDRFDKANRRLDVLALDRAGKLVVVELKLEVKRTLADLQAIRYAAFCSTMTMEQVVEALSDWKKWTQDEAETEIVTFLGVHELPELDNEPRIILAASDMEDQELTSTVLWLRSMGLDISCVEITPYQVGGKLILVPRVIIPLPEAKEYIISVERKQVAQAKARKESAFSPFWKKVMAQFNEEQDMVPDWDKVARGHFQWVYCHPNDIFHYEFCYRKSKRHMDVGVHFETPDRERNLTNLSILESQQEAIARGVEYDFICEPWGKKWASAAFRMPCSGNYDDPEFITEMVRTMILLVERTRKVLEDGVT